MIAAIKDRIVQHLHPNKAKITKSHDLVEILNDCIAIHHDSTFEGLHSDCQMLTRYRMDFIYPGPGVTDLRELGLNERQIEALRLMVNEGQELSNKDYQKMFKVSNATVCAGYGTHSAEENTRAIVEYLCERGFLRR